MERNKWRSGLSIAGVSVAVALLVWTLAYMEGFVAELIRGATNTELGQVQVHLPEYVERPQIFHAWALDDEKRAQVEELEGVVAIAPRVRAFGIIGHEKRSLVAQVTGVVPEEEKKVSLVADALVQGEWFTKRVEGRTDAVIGVGLAKQLGIKAGDELVLLLEAADGSMGNELLHVLGVVETRNQKVDRSAVYMRLEDVQFVAAIDGEIHELAVRVADVLEADLVAQEIQSTLGEELKVRSWRQILPEISQMLDMTEKSDLVMYFMVYLIVAFGLFNSQRMSALERVREFGVMRALGVTPSQLGGVVFLETVWMTAIGAGIGVLVGGAVSYYHMVQGLDLSMFGDNVSFDMMGVSFSNTLKFQVTPRVLLRPVLFLMPVVFICGLYPAWLVSRLDITRSISGRT
ncbi:ABC transporter permease [Microvenator marinus]|uniref:ABC transporter permease n=1 Tax=Microvenator marinus TaxID=2600177 RepID=UPI00201B9645|nr:FtsX-like permease family protein [Microvenator marinus]